MRDEAFTHFEGQKRFVEVRQRDVFPYLLVNIGSGVSIIKVLSPGSFSGGSRNETAVPGAGPTTRRRMLAATKLALPRSGGIRCYLLW